MLPQRVNRKKNKQVAAATNKISDLEKNNNELNKSLDGALRTTLTIRKSVSYLKIKNKKANEKNDYHSYIQSVKEQILFLENENSELEEKIEVFSSQKLSYFENRKYIDTTRMVYEDILLMGFSNRNVEKLIKIVLEKFSGTECDRLPKATISKYMLIEALRLARLHMASELANCEDDNLVLQSDGTIKKIPQIMKDIFLLWVCQK